MDAILSTLFFQLCLASLGFAAPIADDVKAATVDNTWQYGTGGGVLGFVVLILDILVFIEVLKSNRPPVHKLLWCLVVFLLPIIGMVIYWLFSNRASHNSSSGYEPVA